MLITRIPINGLENSVGKGLPGRWEPGRGQWRVSKSEFLHRKGGGAGSAPGVCWRRI